MERIKIIPHNALDLKKWDKAILNSPFPLVFAQSFYLNATAPNWKALVLDNYKAVMPLTQASKLNIKYLHQPPFTSQLGIYGDATKKDVEEIETVLTKNYKFIEIEQNAHTKFQKNVKDKLTYIIDYKKGFKFNDNTKRNISKANKLNCKVSEVVDLESVLKLAKIKIVPWLKKEHKVSETHCLLFLKLITNAFNEQALKCFVTVDESGTPQALGYFIYNDFHAVFLKGMSFHKKDNNGSMHLLMDYAIHYFETKVKLFDFGGGAAAGIATFYKGFGGKELKYQVLKINQLPWPLKILKK
jgi:hypothetical protein